MSNELLYFGVVLIDLALALLAFRMGREWLYVFIITNLLLVTSLAGNVVSIFGFNTTVAGPFYAAIFLATDALTEHYGKNEGHKSVMMGLAAQLSFVPLALLALQIQPVDFTFELHASMDSVFGLSVRVVIASAVAYFVAQNFDIWFFHKIREKTGSKNLWLRNNLSTVASQTLDGLLFFSIAFYGVIPNWIEVAITGTIAKLLIALLDTPFLYMTRAIKKG